MYFNKPNLFDSFFVKLCCLLAFCFTLAAPSANAQGDQLFSDNFNVPDRDLIIDWTPFGATGRDYWYIQNQALTTGNGNNYTPGLTWFTLTRVGTNNWSNYSAGVDVTKSDEVGVIAFAFRWVDNQNFYYANIDSFKRPDTQRVMVQVTLNKVIEGRTIELSSTDSTRLGVIPDFSGNRTNRIEVKANGVNLSLLINGTVVLEATDSSLSRGTIALGQSFNEVVFDNVVVLGGTNATSAAPSAGGEIYRVVLLESQTAAISQGVEKELLGSGFANVTREQQPNGTFSVYVGSFPSRAAAEAEKTNLEGKNFIPIRVESKTVAQPTPTVVAQRTPLPAATPVVGSSINGQLNEIERQAKEAEQRADYATANTLWANYIAIAPSESQKDFGQKQRQAVLDKQSSDRTTVSSAVPGISSGSEEGSSNTLLYIVIGVGALVVIGGIAFFVMTKKSASPAPTPTAAAVAAAAPKPGAPKPKQAPAAAKPAAAPAPAPAPAPVVEPSAVNEEDLPPHDLAEVDSSARIRPGQVSRKKEAGSNPADTDVELKEESSGSVSIGEIRTPDKKSDTEVSVQRNTPKPKLKTPGKDKTDSGLSLDFLFEDKKEGNTPTGSSEFIIPPRPDSNMQIPQGIVASKPDNPDFFFVQNFEDQKEGEVPAGWSGEYEYASLEVVRDDASNAKCMRFEKKEGSGSALFSLNFPDAGGRIIVEFDIRCDEKNKYLLGFYIEKDGNFRQAISTIVHRTNSNSNPTLRLQNESTPYEFGQWTSVKYDLDLPRHLVDGYVDGKPVITAARLAQAPKLMNTFSIRDNLATTGTLLIRNIRVYKGG